MSEITLTVLFDNYAGEKGLRTAHGFSCAAEGFDKTVLFDTGSAGQILLDNMNELGISPQDTDAVVLSHDHWDHVGGLRALLASRKGVTVYMPAVFPEQFKEEVRREGGTVVETRQPVQVCAGVATTAVLGRGVSEQAMWVETARGVVVVTGCAHPGIVELVQSAKEASGGQVYAALGGFHMDGFDAKGISLVIAELKELGVVRVGPCHCSGDRTRQMMQEAFGENYISVGAGSRMVFPAV